MIDLDKTLQNLRQYRDRLDVAIRSIEDLANFDGSKKRGRPRGSSSKVHQAAEATPGEPPDEKTA